MYSTHELLAAVVGKLLSIWIEFFFYLDEDYSFAKLFVNYPIVCTHLEPLDDRGATVLTLSQYIFSPCRSTG